MVRKIITILTAISLSVAPITSVISCDKRDIEMDGPIGKEDDNFYISGPLEKDYKIKQNSTSKDLDYFFGDALHNYANYIEKNGKVVFNGNESAVKKTRAINKKINIWKNETERKQIILVKESKKEITDLNIEILPKEKNSGIELKAQFMNYIKSNNQKTAGHEYIPRGISYTPDQIGYSRLDRLNFDIQPVLLTAISDKQAKPGIYSFNIKVNFKVNNIKNEIKIKQEVKVLNKTLDLYQDKVENENQRFTFNSMINPTNSVKYIPQKSKKININSLEKNNPPIPEWKPEYIPKGQNFKYLYHDEEWKADFLRNRYTGEKIRNQLMRNNYKISDELNQQYAYVSTSGNAFVRTIAKDKNKNRGTNEDYVQRVFKDPVGFVNDKDIEWDFALNPLKEFWKFAAETGFQQLMLSSVTRSTIDFLYAFKEFSWYVNPNDPQDGKYYPFMNLNEVLIDSDGKPTDMFYAYVDKIWTKFIKKLINMYDKEIKGRKEFQTKEGKDLGIVISFDETSEEINNYMLKKLKEIDTKGVIKTHAYLAWQYEVDLNDEKEIMDKVINPYDYATLGQRFFMETEDGQRTINKIIEKRKKLGKVTWIYSSWNNYPGAYLGSGVNEMTWAFLYSLFIGSNGYTRFGLEGERNNVSADYEDTEKTTSEPGSAYLLYPGYGEGSLLSHRIVALQEGYQMAFKLKEISNWKEKVKFIKFVNKFYDRKRETYYKWNLNYYDESHKIKSPTTFSEQVEAVQQIIEKEFN